MRFRTILLPTSKNHIVTSMTCHLTVDEQALFSLLPQELRAKWQESVKTEDQIDGFETAQQMAYRRGMILLDDMPEVRELITAAEKAMVTGDFTRVDFSSLGDKALNIFFSCLGASGVSIFVQYGLQGARTDEDIKAVASFSQVRHGLLQSNLEFFSRSA